MQTLSAPSPFLTPRQKGFSIILILIICTSVMGLLLYILVAAKNTASLVYQRKASKASASSLLDNKFEGEKFEILTSGAVKSPEASASGSEILLFNKNSTAIGMVNGKAESLTLRANGGFCNGQPHILMTIDGTDAFNNYITPDSWNDYNLDLSLDDGNHIFTLSFDNDFSNRNCDSNLKVDYIKFNH
jgi:hypothetical protein